MPRKDYSVDSPGGPTRPPHQFAQDGRTGTDVGNHPDESPKRNLIDPVAIGGVSAVGTAVGADQPDRSVSDSSIEGENREPNAIRPYRYHGIDFIKIDSKEWTAVCPFCDKPKFYVHVDTSKSECKVCHWELKNDSHTIDPVSGNAYGFLKYLYRLSVDSTQDLDLNWLSIHRSLPVEALRRWGICKSVTTGEWLVPGWGTKEPQNLTQLYKYVKQKSGKYELWLTPGMGEIKEGKEEDEGKSHGVHLPIGYCLDNTKIKDNSTVFICEGTWDAIALDHVTNGTLNIIGVPGCGIFNKRWIKYTAKKNVVFLYDNDHPKTHPTTGNISQPGMDGCRRAVGVITDTIDSAFKPLSVSWLDWGGNQTGYNARLADGYDVRDWFTKDNQSFNDLLKLVAPVPTLWLDGSSSVTGSNADNSKLIKPLECKSWKVLTDSFKLAAKWTDELHGALAVSLACVCSVRGVGEPLWVRLVSPPSTYKSQLCKAIATAYKHTLLNDGMKGFFSGTDTGDGRDHALVARWHDKCLITKEGATLMKAPNSEEIIAQARAIYDGDFVSTYKNKLGDKKYPGWRGTWLLAGTPNIKNFDDNELGPRFIDYVIVKDITDELEDDIIMRAMLQQAGSGVVNQGLESSDDPDYLRARQLTAGYINYLRSVIDNDSVKLPNVPYELLVKVRLLAKFIERMRGRPSRDGNTESIDRALPARVAKQLIKLAQFVSVVIQKEDIDREVMGIVCKVALDTSSGFAYDIVSVLDNVSTEYDEDGVEPEQLARKCKRELKEIAKLIMYLCKIEVLEQYIPIEEPLPARRTKIRLTDSFRLLFNQVKGMVE